ERIAEPAPNRRPPRGSTPPPAPPRRPAAPPSRPGPPSRPAPRRPLGARRILRRLAIVLVVLVVAMGASMVYLDGKLARVDALADYDGRVGDTRGTNWLLVGSDSRVGLTPEQVLGRAACRLTMRTCCT